MENKDKWEKAYTWVLAFQAIAGLVIVWLGCLIFALNFAFRFIPEIDGLTIFAICSFLGFLAIIPFLRKIGVWKQLMRNVI